MPVEELKKIGDTLRTAREEKNLSLKEVENATSIRISCLRAIEEGEFQKLISPVYAQGFVKQYANYLGLDGEQMVQLHHSFFGKAEKQEFAYGIGTLEQRGYPGVSSRWMPGALYAIAMAAVLLLAWYFAHFLGLL